MQPLLSRAILTTQYNPSYSSPLHSITDWEYITKLELLSNSRLLSGSSSPLQLSSPLSTSPLLSIADEVVSSLLLSSLALLLTIDRLEALLLRFVKLRKLELFYILALEEGFVKGRGVCKIGFAYPVYKPPLKML